MRAPSLKSPDTFVISVPFTGAATIGNRIYLAGSENFMLHLPAGVKLIAAYVQGYCGIADEYVSVKANDDTTATTLGTTDTTGYGFEINAVLETPLPVTGNGLQVWVESSYDISETGGVLVFRRS